MAVNVLNIHNCEQNSHYNRLCKQMCQGIAAYIKIIIVIISCRPGALAEMRHLPLCSTVLTIDHDNLNLKGPLPNGSIT